MNAEERTHGQMDHKESLLGTMLKESYKGVSHDDLCTIEGIDSATGKPFVADFEELIAGTDTIQKAVERGNKEA